MEWATIIIYLFIVMELDPESTTDKEIFNYYKLKQKYEKKLEKQRENLLKNEQGLSSWKERRRLYKKLNIKCINCTKRGGTIFSNNQGVLTAVCGNKEQPCDLNIEISKGLYGNIRNISYSNTKKIYELKLQIISVKLDYLFGYLSQEKTVELFDPLRAELAKLTAVQLGVDQQYTLAVNNPTKEALIKEDELKLEIEIVKLKKLGKVYLAGEEPAIVKNMVENYLTIFVPLNKNIRENKYMLNGIQHGDDGSINMVSNGYTAEQLERKIN